VSDQTLLGYQLTVCFQYGEHQCWTVYDGVPDEVIDRLMRYWRRPDWLRFGTLTLTDERTGADQVLMWKNVLDIRVQPQREVI
jgi:hypothetical protein